MRKSITIILLAASLLFTFLAGAISTAAISPDTGQFDYYVSNAICNGLVPFPEGELDQDVSESDMIDFIFQFAKKQMRSRCGYLFRSRPRRGGFRRTGQGSGD
ncbi:MAG: hypothetical protein FWE80_01640 [Oscillospiraceae bacterium]|nr:hypothetical protein [Oscillospiraceae bacterium]